MYKLAIIPDGNRTYAKREKTTLKKAYEMGFQRGEDVLDWCLEQGEIDEVTLWGLSTENVARAPEQLELLNSMYKANLEKLLNNPKVYENKVKINIVGDENFLEKLEPLVNEIHEKTKNHDKFTVNIALAYGGRDEILCAVRKAVDEKGNNITKEDIEKNLMIPHNPDLIIRTSGTQRLSGYLSWQCAYSELFFSKQLWPEFSKKEFLTAIDFLKKSKKNFGK